MIKQILAFFVILASFLYASPLCAQTREGFPQGNFEALSKGGTASVIDIIDPQTLLLSDGRTIHLAGLEFPDNSQQDSGEFSVIALNILKDMLTGQSVEVYQTKKRDWGRTNRMGHHIAHLRRVEGDIWVQGALLSLGLARVQTSQRTPEMAAQMYAIEQQARNKNQGLWAEEAYRVLSPEDADSALGHYAIIQGRVESAALKKNRIYLNFGKNWREDFTVSIPPESKRVFSKQGLDPLKFNGMEIRVRGWVDSYNGPYIEIDHPEAIEIIEKRAKEAPPP